jgi:signal peptidase I
MSTHDDGDRSDAFKAGLVATWKQVTFKPREFFSRRADQRSVVGPVGFAVIVGIIAAALSAGITLGAGERDVDKGRTVIAVILSPILTLFSVYMTAAFQHLFFRIIGTGRRERFTAETHAPVVDASESGSDKRYQAPTTDVGFRGIAPSSFRETLQAVGYSHAPVLFEALGALGLLIGAIWTLVIMIIALSCVHRTSILRSAVVTLSVLVGPVFLALFIRTGVVEAFKIPSGAMIPSLMIGDHLFVSKLAYGPLLPNSDTRLFSRLPPARGDVMVFKFPENKAQDFIKRAIALPGDRLDVINGRPIINGWLVPHCFVGKFGKDQGRLYVEFYGKASYLTLFAPDEMHSNGPDESTCRSTDDCGTGQSCIAGICGYHQGPFKVAANEVWVMGDNRHNSHDSRSWRGGMGAGVPFENIKGRAMFVWMSFRPDGGVASDRIFVNIMGSPTLPGEAKSALQGALDKCMRERPSLEKTTPPTRASAMN